MAIFSKKNILVHPRSPPFLFYFSSKISVIFPSLKERKIKVDLICLRNPHVIITPPLWRDAKRLFLDKHSKIIATIWKGPDFLPEMSGILETRIPTYCNSALVLKQKINEKMWSKFVRKFYWKKFEESFKQKLLQ